MFELLVRERKLAQHAAARVRRAAHQPVVLQPVAVDADARVVDARVRHKFQRRRGPERRHGVAGRDVQRALFDIRRAGHEGRDAIRRPSHNFYAGREAPGFRSLGRDDALAGVPGPRHAEPRQRVSFVFSKTALQDPARPLERVDVEAQLQRVVPVRDEHRLVTAQRGSDVVGLVADDLVLKLLLGSPVQQLGEGGGCRPRAVARRRGRVY